MTDVGKFVTFIEDGANAGFQGKILKYTKVDSGILVSVLANPEKEIGRIPIPVYWGPAAGECAN